MNLQRMISGSDKEKELIKYASVGNYEDLEKMRNCYSFTEIQIDNAFRACVKNFKNQNESYVKTLKFFLKETKINYQNPNNNNSTILMYSFETGQEIPCQLIIDCCNEDLDYNIVDDSNENCLFKLLKNDNLSEEVQNEFLTRLLSNRVDLEYKNSNGESVITLIEKKGKKSLKEAIVKYKEDSKFEIEKYITQFTHGEYMSIIEKIKYFQDREVAFFFYNYAFQFNILLTEMKMGKKQIQQGFIAFNQIVEKEICIAEYQFNIMHILKELNVTSHLAHDKILLLNKLIMYYQLDYFVSFENTKREIENNYIDNTNLLLFVYMNTMFVQMLIERKKIYQAKDEMKRIENKINTYNEEKENYIVNREILSNFYQKYKIFPIYNKNELQTLIKLYNIFIMMFIQENMYQIDNKENNSTNLTSSKFKKAIELITNLNLDEKLCSYPLYMFYSFLHIHLLYYTSHFSLNRINSKLEHLLQYIDKNDEYGILFYLNSYGILNLKRGNYNLALYYFNKCENIIKSRSLIQLIKRNHFYPSIAYNIALSYFFLKKYDNCINILTELMSGKNRTYIKNSKYVYYRLALAQLESSLRKIQNKDINDVYLNYTEQNTFILNHTNKDIKNKIPEDIIVNFKQVLLYCDYTDPIYFNTCANLIFTLILREQYLEAIFYLKKIKTSSLEEKNIINSYFIQCYLFLGKIEEAEIYTEKIILNEEFSASFYESFNNKILPFEKFNVCYYANMVKLCIKNNKKDDINKYLILILNPFVNLSISATGVKSSEELPPFVINIFVYYYLFINRKDLAINILKTRRIKQILLPNNSNNSHIDYSDKKE